MTASTPTPTEPKRQEADSVRVPEPPAGVRRKRSTRNLLMRGFSAIAALALTYYCLWYDATHAGAWAWAILMAAGCIPALREFYRLAGASGTFPFTVVGYVFGPAWLLASAWDLSPDLAKLSGINAANAVVVLAGLCTLLLQLTRRTNDNAVENVSTTIFGILYCAILPGMLIHLRHLRMSEEGWPMDGIEFVVVCIFVSKVSDVGALLTGSRWGKHKLIPRLSPGKTWEGAIGGMVFSIALLQWMVLIEPNMVLARLGRPMLVLLSAVLAMAGLAGDLVESSFKRGSRRKDAGAGVPGFGGILDLIDSLMVATPVMYFFLVICGAKYIHA